MIQPSISLMERSANPRFHGLNSGYRLQQVGQAINISGSRDLIPGGFRFMQSCRIELSRLALDGAPQTQLADAGDLALSIVPAAPIWIAEDGNWPRDLTAQTLPGLADFELRLRSEERRVGKE